MLLGGGPTAVPVARSLYRAGVPVYALGGRADPLRRSRYRTAFVELGGEDGGDGWLSWLATGPRDAVVLPCADQGLELVARRRGEIEALGHRTIEADDEVLLAMLDKHRTYSLARAAGVPVPFAAAVRAPGDLDGLPEHVPYPCALKPIHSHRFAQHFREKAFVVGDPDELERALEPVLGLGLEMLVMEIVAPRGEDYRSYYGYLDERGEPLLHVTKRKLRQYPVGFGTGCYHVTDWDPEVARLGLQFLRGVGARGLACVEFKRDPQGGGLKLIECNHRFTAATGLLDACGVDLPLFTYNRILDRPPPPVDDYRRGVALWYPVQDLLALREYRRRGQLSFRSWLRSLFRPLRFPVARWDDPLPTLLVHAAMLRRPDDSGR